MIQFSFSFIAARNFECQSNFVPIDSKCSKYSKPLEDILDTVPPESAALSPSDTLNIFRSLSEVTHKQSKPTDSSYNVTNHKGFAILCQALKISMPYISMNERLDILKAIQNLCVPIDSKIYSAVLISFHENLFSMSLNEIMILDRVLCDIHKTQMVDDLRCRLVDQFNLKSSNHKIEFIYFKKMRRILQFIERNRHEIIEEVFENFEKCAAKQNLDILTAREAMDTIILLSSFGKRSESVWPILNKAFDVWCNSEVSMQMAEIALRILVRRNRHGNDVSRYKDRRFIETCARTAIASGDSKKCFLILRYLNQLVSLFSHSLHSVFVMKFKNLKIACISFFRSLPANNLSIIYLPI